MTNATALRVQVDHAVDRIKYDSETLASILRKDDEYPQVSRDFLKTLKRRLNADMVLLNKLMNEIEALNDQTNP